MNPQFTWAIWSEMDPIVLLTFAIRSFAFFSAVGLLTLFFRRQSAATRHFVLVLAMLGSLVLPMITFVLPAWRVLPSSWSTFIGKSGPKHSNIYVAEAGNTVPASITTESASAGAFPYVSVPQTQVVTADAEAPVVVNAESTLQLLTAEPESHSSAWIWWTDFMEFAQARLVQLCLWVWLFGIVITFIPVALGFLRLRGLYQNSKPLPAPLALQLASLAAELCPGRKLDGRITDVACLPMTWGLRAPVLLLPAQAANWSFERRRLVMLHELAHVRRLDYVTQLIGQLARSVYWFNPLAWYALSLLRTEQEHAADDCVMEAGVSPEEYASELLTITSRIPKTEWDTSLALAMGRKERLSNRLAVVLNPDQKRGGLKVSHALFVSGFVIASSCVIAISEPKVITAAPPDLHDQPAGKPVSQPQVIPQDKVLEPAIAETPTPIGNAPQAPNSKVLSSEVANEAKPRSQVITEILERIENLSALPVDAAKLEEGAIRGILEALRDPHSQLMSAEEFRTLSQHLEGRMAGIGVVLKQEESRVVVAQTLPNSAARKSGIQPGEILIRVDGTQVSNVAEAAKMIRGVVGTDLTLSMKVDVNADEKNIAMTRGHVEIPMIQGWDLKPDDQWSYWIDQSNGIAYIRILSFSQNLAKEFRRTVLELTGNGLRGLVIDLRGCGGGLFHEMIDVASCFMSDVPVADIKSRQELDTPLRTNPSAPFPDVPLMVLINAHTASAAEVITAALQEQDRAVVVGERSFGKGTIQTFVPLGEGQKSLRLTVGLLTTAKGRALQRDPNAISWGVDPNEGFYVPSSVEEIAAREKRSIGRTSDRVLTTDRSVDALRNEEHDAQLAAAVGSLSGYLETGKYATTGKPLSEMQHHLNSIDELLQERDQLRNRLRELEAKLEGVVK